MSDPPANGLSRPPPDADGQVAVLDKVSRIYQMGTTEVHALAGVSLSFERGSFTAIMGPSGSGKSTLLNLMGCLDRPTSGVYWLEGRNVGTLYDDELSALRLRHLGFVFQSFNLVPQLTVRENIELPLYYMDLGPEESAACAAELAESVGLGDRLEHRSTELSGGQMQRVAVARALANDPNLLLADEPTGNLDSETGKQIISLLCDLNERGKSIILVTHETDIAAHARRQVYMRDGRVDRIEGEGD